MLRPKISLGDHFAILLLMVKIAAWLVSIVSCMIVALFRLGATCAKRCRTLHGRSTRAPQAWPRSK
jgi:hypothetical protein